MTKETADMLEEAIANSTVDLEAEQDAEKKAEIADVIKTLSESLAKLTHEENERISSTERNRIENEKVNTMKLSESAKNSLTYGKVALDLIKTFGPIAITVAAYDVFQKRVIQFEETGKFRSTASKQLNLPRFMK